MYQKYDGTASVFKKTRRLVGSQIEKLDVPRSRGPARMGLPCSASVWLSPLMTRCLGTRRRPALAPSQVKKAKARASRSYRPPTAGVERTASHRPLYSSTEPTSPSQKKHVPSQKNTCDQKMEPLSAPRPIVLYVASAHLRLGKKNTHD